MNRIINKQVIAQDIKRLDIAAPRIASKARPGQFVMIAPNMAVKPIPISIVDKDERKGSVSFIIHEIGPVTRALGAMSISQEVGYLIGPLGKEAVIEKYGLVICIATGIGAAQVLPICRALKKKGNRVLGIIGAKSKKVLMLEAQMRVVCDELFIATNDGSYERKGLASQILAELLGRYDVNAVYAIGSAEMMKTAVIMAAPKDIPVWVTLNPYMNSGLGRCGSCRVLVDSAYQLACVDGPQFDGRLVDFEHFTRRESALKEQVWEKQSLLPSPKNDGFPTLVKSFLGMAKKKT